ncbi:DUF2946 family protein [Maritalea myrionectae]|uniref:DUF2946 domain-containing protein n=1 Tax=Maritalea myrionectae TaxID=454601 RepID=A0A2R4MBM1_9HYPH|nr:DUF2946 family protein [Maritalea myrionectae]AVX03344.1 hypothetical protein MXMO3_00812 [Maritalea myrionectae]
MFRRIFEIAKQLLPRFDRKERSVALAIFLLLQAMLPSYAAALSSLNGQDGLILCTTHGLIEVQDDSVPAGAQGDGGLCVMAQVAGFALADLSAAPVLQFAIPQGRNTNNLYSQPQVGRLDLFEPQAQRAPPILI